MNIENCKLPIANFRTLRLPTPDSRSPRPAYTLVEIMVVLVIMVILVATLLPVLKRVLDNDRVREGTRTLSAYMSLAKTRAVQTGRPCGMIFVLDRPVGWVDPSPATGVYVRQCTKMFLAEVPPHYSGSSQGAKGRIRLSLTLPPTANIYEFYPLFLNEALTPPAYEEDPAERAYLRTLIEPGEQFLIRFNGTGPWYRCQRGSATSAAPYTDPTRLYYTMQTVMGNSTPMMVVMGVPTPVPGGQGPYPPGITDISPQTTPPAPPGNPGYAYQIMRSPRPIGKPLELTGGTCIDMVYSGMGISGAGAASTSGFASFNTSLALIFTPSGGVTGVYGDGAGPVTPTGTVHFLLGRVNKINDPTANTDGDTVPNMFDLDDCNLADSTSLWVSIGRQNGTVTTAENQPNPTWTDYTTAGRIAFLTDARAIATGRLQMGGQ